MDGSTSHVLGFKFPNPSKELSHVASTTKTNTQPPFTALSKPKHLLLSGRDANKPAPTRFEKAAASSYDDALAYVMKIIHAEDVTPEEAADMTKDVITAWNAHINPGFLKVWGVRRDNQAGGDGCCGCRYSHCTAGDAASVGSLWTRLSGCWACAV